MQIVKNYPEPSNPKLNIEYGKIYLMISSLSEKNSSSDVTEL